jgi:hypothetical protein
MIGICAATATILHRTSGELRTTAPLAIQVCVGDNVISLAAVSISLAAASRWFRGQTPSNRKIS